MYIQKLLIATISLAGPLAVANPALADDQWNPDDDWNDDDDWHGGHGGHGGWHNDGKGARLRNLQFVDKGVRLVAFGELEGVKKYKPAKILVKARGDAEAVCINPGGHIPPGKNPVDADEVSVFGRKSLDLSSFYGGAIEFKVSTDKPDLWLDGAPDCPNWKWSEKIVDLAFTEVELTVVQDGKKVLELECFFDDPTRDGKVRGDKFDCNPR